MGQSVWFDQFVALLSGTKKNYAGLRRFDAEFCYCKIGFVMTDYRKILWLDCLGGLFVGAIVILICKQLSVWESLPLSIVLTMGIANLGYGMYSLFVTTRRPRSVSLIKTLAIANMGWLFVCLLIVYATKNQVSLLGFIHVIGEGVYVFYLGLTEWRLREKLAVDSNANMVST